MSKPKDGGMMFPTPVAVGSHGDTHGGDSNGCTFRQWAAVTLAAGICNSHHVSIEAEWIASVSIQMADEIIKRLED